MFNYYNEGNRLELLNETTIIWPGNTKTAPVGRPKCGFDNELCPTTTDKQRKFNFLSLCFYIVLFLNPWRVNLLNYLTHFRVMSGESKEKRPAFEKILLPEYHSNDVD